MRKEAIEKFILKANKILKGDNMDINITTQLEDFGLKELDDAAKLLLVYKKEIREDKLTDEFKKEDVKLCFNKNNGKVKLVNVYGDALVRDDNRLFLERVVD
jgi:L-lactate utilization protein LutC